MSSYTYPAVTPPGQSPPFAVVTDLDHRAWIFISAALGLSMTLLSSAIRIFIRYGTKSTWGLDDGSLALATLLAFVQTALILLASHNGLGSSEQLVRYEALQKAQKAYYASNLLYVLSLGASRLSILFLLRRLTPVREHIRALDCLLCGEGAWTVAILLAVAIQCNLRMPWVMSPMCGNGWFVRWEVAEITAALFEIAMFVVAVWALVWKLQMPLQRKALIVTVFGLRLPLLTAVLGLRLASFDKDGFRSDASLHEASFICWTQTEMNLSIIAATIPMAQKLLSRLTTYYGGAGGRTTNESTYTSSQGRKVDAVRLQNLSDQSSNSRGTKSEPPCTETFEDATANCRYDYEIQAPRKKTRVLEEEELSRRSEAESSRSYGSHSMMVRKDVSYQIDFDK